MKRFYVGAIIAVAAAFTAQGQSNPPETRAEEIESQRSKKAAHLTPDDVTPLERITRSAKENHWLDRLSYGYNGFRPKIGNMVTGGGFAIGPEYYRDDLGDGK